MNKITDFFSTLHEDMKNVINISDRELLKQLKIIEVEIDLRVLSNFHIFFDKDLLSYKLKIYLEEEKRRFKNISFEI